MTEKVEIGRKNASLLGAVMDRFVVGGHAPTIEAFLKEYGYTPEEFDAALKEFGDTIGTDMGWL